MFCVWRRPFRWDLSPGCRQICDLRIPGFHIYSFFHTAFNDEEAQAREQPLYHYGFGRLGRISVRVVG